MIKGEEGGALATWAENLILSLQLSWGRGDEGSRVSIVQYMDVTAPSYMLE